MKILRLILAVGLVCLLAACSVARPVAPEEPWDPIEPINRGIFWFNDKADIYVIEPAANAYDYVLPDAVKDSVGSFFRNLRGPVRVVNSLLQLEGEQAAHQFARLLINTTAGAAGFFDVAAKWGVHEVREDLGLTFANYGIKGGPYLVLPLLGPSTLRDTVGDVGDMFLDPVFHLGNSMGSDSESLAVTGGIKALEIVQTRYELTDAIEASRKSSLDRYLFVQSAYYQLRAGRINQRLNGELSIDAKDEFDLAFDAQE